jgi:hypothetical protein
VKSNHRIQGRGRRAWSNRRPWQYSLFALFVLTTVCAILLSAGKSYPLETLIVGGIVAGAVLAVIMYIGELVVIGWVMDFPAWLVERALPAAHVPLEYEVAGEILVVTLSDNIASVRECRSVQQQLDRLIAGQHCDVILDFTSIKKLSSGFREVLTHVTQTARGEAEKRGKSYRDLDRPIGETFLVFDDREQALAEMLKHDGHGWVVLCAVPVGIRAVSDAG